LEFISEDEELIAAKTCRAIGLAEAEEHKERKKGMAAKRRKRLKKKRKLQRLHKGSSEIHIGTTAFSGQRGNL
jgi:predicted transcriptional regulator of viral defense system